MLGEDVSNVTRDDGRLRYCRVTEGEHLYTMKEKHMIIPGREVTWMRHSPELFPTSAKGVLLYLS